MRDSQRSKLYRAENQLRILNRKFFKELNYTVSLEDMFDSVITELKNSGHKRYNKKTLNIKLSVDPLNKNKHSWCHYNRDHRKIELNGNGCCLLILLHEIAHAILYEQDERREIAPHGAEFCGLYANLIAVFISHKMQLMFIELMVQNRVKFNLSYGMELIK